MSSQPTPRQTPAEYLALERSAEIKSEYFAGEIFAMAGASREHNLIVANLVRELGNGLRHGPCEVYPSDMRVKVDTTGLYTYPDVVVVCDPPQFEDDSLDTLLNPTLLIEVLSESTEKYDRGKKSSHYRQLDSLQEYLLVSQDEAHVEHYARQDKDHWILTECAGCESTIALPVIDFRLALAEVYARVSFSSELASQ